MIDARKLLRRQVGLFRRQTARYRLMVARRALHGLACGLTSQYNSLYASLLGADAVQLGSLQSVGSVIGALASLPVGYLVDCYSLRNVLLLGTAFMVASRVLYFAAPYWTWLYAAIVLYYLAMRITCTSCTVTCALELDNEDRATGRGLCRSLVSPLSIVAPLLAAALIAGLGGIRADSIRPIYGIQAILFAGIFVMLLARLSPSRALPGGGDRGLWSGFAEVFRQGPDVVRLLWIMGLGELPWSLALTFVPVYAHEVKGASEFVIGGISIASAIVPMLASIPLGRLADRLGRKRLLFAIAPLAYAGNFCLILAPASNVAGSLLLLLYGVLFGFNSIAVALAAAMAAEVMPKKRMGHWIGSIGLFRSLLGIPAPLLGGLIWKHAGPHFVFLTSVAIDVLLRLPLLARTRETLHMSTD